jgi:hypothetical protein
MPLIVWMPDSNVKMAKAAEIKLKIIAASNIPHLGHS